MLKNYIYRIHLKGQNKKLTLDFWNILDIDVEYILMHALQKKVEI